MSESPKTEYAKGLDLPEMRRRMAEAGADRDGTMFTNIVTDAPFVPELDPVNRRSFMKFFGATLSMAGLTACTKQVRETIVPYVDAPEDLIPGKPLRYATAMPFGGTITPLLATSHMGRPTKLEGNAEHPSSYGGTDVFAQASIRDLYDPDRSQAVMHKGRGSTFMTFDGMLEKALAGFEPAKGKGMAVMLESTSSPTQVAQLAKIRERFPEANVVFYDAAGRDNETEGLNMAFGGKPMTPVYHFDKAKRVLSLDSDFLNQSPAHLKYARDFAQKRNFLDIDPVDQKSAEEVNRLYVLESAYTATGVHADHRLAIRSSSIGSCAAAIAKRLGLGVDAPALGKQLKQFVDAVAADLKAHPGESVVVCGEHQPPEVHALTLAINEQLQAFGSTIRFIEPVTAGPGAQFEKLRELVKQMHDGAVSLLIMLDVNPVYNTPADLGFEEALSRVKESVHAGFAWDETGKRCAWHVPLAHYLEAWGDGRTFDGTASIIQPLIAPLYGGRSLIELLAPLAGQFGMSGHEIVQAFWKGERDAAAMRTFWRTALHDGYLAEDPGKPKPVEPGKVAGEVAGGYKPAPEGKGLELNFRPDPGVWDGRFANNAWLLEMPNPVTTLTWDNAVIMSPTTAVDLKLARTEVEQKRVTVRPKVKTVDLRLGEEAELVAVPLLLSPGHAKGSITLHLGYGRTSAGEMGNGVGFNPNLIRRSSALHIDTGVEVDQNRKKYELALTQDHYRMVGVNERHLARVTTIAELQDDPHLVAHMAHDWDDSYTMYPPFDYTKGHQWAMGIDMNRCISCNACLIACQSENNIPSVGKDQVMTGRELHWIRVDRYYDVTGVDDDGEVESLEIDRDDIKVFTQPVACMHCELAPCETVCPVGATVHSNEGLNQMVYNRCVGTRYCSNNCPYKVRRFNYFQYGDLDTPSLKLKRNPDVSTRVRGVMEKCTYCVQRINYARIEAKKDFSRKTDDGQFPIRHGEVITACQQVCPTGAISFGNLNDPLVDSKDEKKVPEVVRLRGKEIAFGLLDELNTRPRTSYLARLRNTNLEIEPKPAKPHGHGHDAHKHEGHGHEGHEAHPKPDAEPESAPKSE